MSTERKFSFLYSQIVDSQNDLIGHIAYSLYKTQKIEFIKSFKEKNDNRVPTEEELHAFHMASEPSIPALKVHAEQILAAFIELTLKESIEDIERETLLNQQNILKEIIEPIKPKNKGPWSGFWMGVLIKFVQALIVGFIFFIIIFGASAANDFWGTVRKFLPESHASSTDTIRNAHKP